MLSGGSWSSLSALGLSLHAVVVRRREVAICGWRDWLREILWLILISGCVLIWFRPFCSVILLLLLVVCLTP